MAKTILIVDDKANVTRLLSDYLTERGFRAVVANNGREALFTARHEKPDLILLDIMMPEMDGYEFIKVFRKESNVPIILLTALMEETDKVLGLELGADDYVTKPFGMSEIAARIRAVLRRVGSADDQAAKSDVLRVGDLSVDLAMRTVRVGQTSISLTPSEFDLLTTLMRHPGHVYSRTDLLEILQGTVIEGVERTIDVHIRNLRTKIEPDPKNPVYIETVFGVGYRCVPDDYR